MCEKLVTVGTIIFYAGQSETKCFHGLSSVKYAAPMLEVFNGIVAAKEAELGSKIALTAFNVVA